MTRDELADRLGLPSDHPIIRGAATALRLVEGTDTSPGASRLGGVPDLPEETEWPFWDQREFARRELEHARSQLAEASDANRRGHWKGRVRKLERKLELKAPLRPLSFLAQLRCADLAGSGLPLPPDGLLSFFYDVDEQPWGYEPAHTGAWRVFYTPEGAPLVPRSPPTSLDPKLVIL